MGARETLPILMAIFMAVDVVVVSLRLWVRITKSAIGYDDYAIVVATIGFLIMCSFCFVSLSYGFGATDPSVIASIANYDVISASKYFTIAQITYVTGFPIVRISVALVLHRIVQGLPRIPGILVASMVVVAIYSLGCILVDVLQCIPLQATWGVGTGKCLSSHQLAGLGFAVSALDIASSLFYAVLPIFVLGDLNMDKRTKLSVIVMLGLGAVTVVFGIVRLKSLVKIVDATSTAEALELELESFIYSVLEFGISIFTASLVAFRFLMKYLGLGSTGRSSAKPRLGGIDANGQGAGGANQFELGRNNNPYSTAIRLDDNDSDSQRDILRDGDDVGVWKHSQFSVTYAKAGSKG
ncbi:hypothetical protein BX600DRAFT_462894 [Xylariales sp. PMI_506]|nr:hypothetical protein BX600DRAFT_462894 [Xylariales sp. PMI_506]